MQAENTNVSNGDGEPPKRKRGRPRKIVPEGTVIEEPKPKRPRGRPRKFVAEGDKVATAASTTTTGEPKVARPRGRPRKSGVAKVDAEPKEKRPRGRPRKYPAVAETKESKDASRVGASANGPSATAEAEKSSDADADDDEDAVAALKSGSESGSEAGSAEAVQPTFEELETAYKKLRVKHEELKNSYQDIKGVNTKLAKSLNSEIASIQLRLDKLASRGDEGKELSEKLQTEHADISKSVTATLRAAGIMDEDGA